MAPTTLPQRPSTPPPPPVADPATVDAVDEQGNRILYKYALVTGFSQFAHLDPNPSWLAVKPLHNVVLDLGVRSVLDEEERGGDQRGEERGKKQVRTKVLIQCIQVPVAWRAVLDLVPRLHTPGLPSAPSPFAEPWLDPKGEQSGWGGDGRSFPLGYSHLRLPPLGGKAHRWDFVLHVGTGRNGAIALENLAHKDGYRAQSLDVRKESPPAIVVAHPKVPTDEVQAQNRHVGQNEDGMVDSEKASRALPSAHWSLTSLLHTMLRGLLNLFHPARLVPTPASAPAPAPSTNEKSPASSSPFFFAPLASDQEDRGFGQAYEPFAREEHTLLNLDALQACLLQPNSDSSPGAHGPIRQSHDPGRYLCDFIYYTSLAESRRACEAEADKRQEAREDGASSGRTPVLFIHCPDVGQPQSSAQVTAVLRDVVRWVCEQS
ncbi:hypothetical protein OC842_003203 [Tilletia horrida]|uniref:Peptidase C15, pyroglutamyl peptidase I-like protein n=1 Tax=Tilletia horrida TaxID=155126 RepID=A0AAN6GEL3_9BASI|nr:hypothetical protein OC842_003203 [Tilletia horrida]